MNNKIFTNENPLLESMDINIDNIVDVNSVNSSEELTNLLLANGLTKQGANTFYSPLSILTKITCDAINIPECLKLYSDFINVFPVSSSENIMICILVNNLNYRNLKISVVNWKRIYNSAYSIPDVIWEEDMVLPSSEGVFENIMCFLAEAQISKYFYIRNLIFAAFNKIIETAKNSTVDESLYRNIEIDNEFMKKILIDRCTKMCEEEIFINFDFELDFSNNIKETIEYMIIHETEYFENMMLTFKNTMLR